MKIIFENATAKLVERVKSLEPVHHSSWRCIHLSLWDNPERYNHGLRTHFVARALIERLTDMDGYMFLCDDGDIFILFQGPIKAITRKLASHFDELTPDRLHMEDADARFTLYDFSNNWRTLYNLCRDKLLEVLAAPEGFYAPFAYSPEMPRA